MADEQQVRFFPRVIWEGSDGSTKARVVQTSATRAVAERVETDALGGIRWVAAEGDRYFASGITGTLVKAVLELHGLVEATLAELKQVSTHAGASDAEIARLKNELAAARGETVVTGPLVSVLAAEAASRPRIGGAPAVHRPPAPDFVHQPDQPEDRS